MKRQSLKILGFKLILGTLMGVSFTMENAFATPNLGDSQKDEMNKDEMKNNDMPKQTWREKLDEMKKKHALAKEEPMSVEDMKSLPVEDINLLEDKYIQEFFDKHAGDMEGNLSDEQQDAIASRIMKIDEVKETRKKVMEHYLKQHKELKESLEKAKLAREKK